MMLYLRIKNTSVDIYREQQKQGRDESQDAFFLFLFVSIVSTDKQGSLKSENWRTDLHHDL
jgi:hypothetical protein